MRDYKEQTTAILSEIMQENKQDIIAN